MAMLFRDGLSEKEFKRYIRIARGLSNKQKQGRDSCIGQLAKIGVKALGPILYVIEQDAVHEDGSSEDYDNFNKACFEAVERIGEPSLPVLEKYVMEDRVHGMVNIFSQKAIFEVLGIDEEERKSVCKHREAVPHLIHRKLTYTCMICEKTISEEEWLDHDQ